VRAPELSILTVCFGSAEWLRLNFDRYSESNPDTPAHWIFVENDTASCPLPTGPNVTHVPGPGPVAPGPFQASRHHAAALHKGLEKVATRYLLVLDPDFFPLTQGWAKRLLATLRERDLAVLGAEWEKSDFTKPRGFPSPHFLLVDTAKIPKERLDFSPDPHLTARWEPLKKALDRVGTWTGKYRATQFLRRWLLSGTSHDTGSRIASRFRSARSELLPVRRRAWRGTRWLDEVEWNGELFAVHLRQVRAREHGESWTLESGTTVLSEVSRGIPCG